MESSERRKSILMAAKTVFAKKGYNSAGVADIIGEAGIARGTFYLYFKSKRDVFSALMEYLIEALKEQLEAIPVNEPLKILRSLMDNVDKIKSFFFDDPDFAKIMMREAVTIDAASSEKVDEISHIVASWLVELISEWQNAGIILKHLDPQIIAFSFIGTIKEVIQQYLISGNLSCEASKVTEDILQVYILGIIERDAFKLAYDHIQDITS